MCSPTRVALLTGRNHHSCNMGSINENGHRVPPAKPGRDRRTSPPRRDAATERIQHGPSSQEPRNPAVGAQPVRPPFDRWPTRSGFDKFYGFMGGETNQYYPGIYDGVARVESAPATRTTTSRPT